MTTIDTKSVQQIFQKKNTFGRTKCLSTKNIVCESLVLHKNVLVSNLHITEILYEYIHNKLFFIRLGKTLEKHYLYQ